MRFLRKITLIAALSVSAAAFAYDMPTTMYVSGNSSPNGFTNWFNTWGVTARQMMTKESDGTFVWMGKLTTDEDGSLRLFVTPNQWTQAFAPAVTNTAISSQTAEYPVTYYADGTDNNFKIETAGYYKLTLSLTPQGPNDGSLKVEYLGENAFNFELPTWVWMTGDSTPNGWTQGPTFSSGRQQMEKTGYNTYEYVGTLKAAESNGLKFMADPWAWYPAFGPVTDGVKITPDADATYDIIYLAEPADTKFAVEKEDTYILTLTLDPINPAGNKLEVICLDSAVEEIDADENAVEEMYNLNGVKVSRENAAPGIYIVKKGSKTSKVVVK